jgi:hypothetical protein
VESLDPLRKSRRVIEDFSSRTLAAIPSVFGRLYYVSALRDPATGRYEHEGLIDLYSEAAVQEALAHCHEELFLRILETPLSEQEADLCVCLGSSEDRFGAMVENWRRDRGFRNMCPEGIPCYLTDLFSSSLDAVLDILSADRITSGPASWPRRRLGR